MLKLNTNEERSLQFEVSIQGINFKELSGSLKFVVEGVEYGFPVEILSDYISVKIPPLDSIVRVGLKDGKVIDCKLDIFGNGFYLNPWNDQFKVNNPVRMEAKMMSEDHEIPTYLDPEAEKELEKHLSVKLKGEEEEEEMSEGHDELDPEEDAIPKKLPPDEYTEINKDEIVEMLTQILEKKKIKVTPTEKSITESKQVSPKKKVVVSKTGQKYLVSEKVAAKLTEMSSLVNKKLKKTKPLIEKKKSKVDSDNTDPITLMESLGMKNKAIQEVMLEKAKAMGGEDPMSQYAALERLLGASKDRSLMEEMEKVHNSVRFGMKDK